MAPKTASDDRQTRAEQITIQEKRRISDDVWEIDVINDRGEKRENITIVPGDIYSPTKDMQHRGPSGVVGKYLRALAMADDDAQEKLLDAIRRRRDSVQEEMSHLRKEDANLLHAQSDLSE